MKKIVRIIILSFVLICGCVALEGMCSDAKSSKPKIARKTIWIYSDGGWTHAGDLYSENDGTLYPDEFISIASSNEDVLEVAEQDAEHNGYFFNPLKPGKTKVTLTYKYKGKTYNESKTINVKKFPQVVKKATLNGKNVTKSLKKGYYSNYKYKKGTIQINLKPKKGWKIKRITYTYPEYKTIKNNQQVTIPKKQWARVRYLLKNKKGDEVGLNFNIERK